MSRTEAAVLLLAGCLVAPAAAAHGLHARQGHVIVHPDRVVTRVQAGDDGLPWELLVRDGNGVRRRVRVTAHDGPDEDGHRWVTLEHALDGKPRWLTFQLAPDPDPRGLERRLALTVRDALSSLARTIELTSGGNAETLRFPELDEPPSCGPEWLDRHPERLRSVQALLRRGPGRTTLDVVIPYPLIETWLPMARADADFLSPGEQDAMRDGIARFVGSRVRTAKGWSESDVAFLGLDDAALAPAPRHRRLSAMIARVRVHLQSGGREQRSRTRSTAPPGKKGMVDWDLFNSLVLGADAVVIDGGTCETRRITTTDRHF